MPLAIKHAGVTHRMSKIYAIVLRDCSDATAATVAGLVGKAFGLKDATSTNIVNSKPIVLIDGLAIDEVAACSLALRVLEVAGATISYIIQGSEDLPKIDWPKTPKIFKLAMSTIVRAYDMPLNHNGSQTSLLGMLQQQILGNDTYEPQVTAAAQQAPPQVVQIPPSTRLSSIQEFTGANLPEVTPFSNVALSDNAPVSANPTANILTEDSDIGNRMDQLFGDDDDEIAPSSSNITSVLDRILPDEQSGTGTITHNESSAAATAMPNMPPPAEVSGINQILPSGTGNFSLFLSKIPDENRRNNAIPILIELAKITEEDAQKLAKKVIIPVLKGVSQEEAESAKHRFAEIGVLARIKNS